MKNDERGCGRGRMMMGDAQQNHLVCRLTVHHSLCLLLSFGAKRCLANCRSWWDTSLPPDQHLFVVHCEVNIFNQLAYFVQQCNLLWFVQQPAERHKQRLHGRASLVTLDRAVYTTIGRHCVGCGNVFNFNIGEEGREKKNKDVECDIAMMVEGCCYTWIGVNLATVANNTTPCLAITVVASIRQVDMEGGTRTGSALECLCLKI